MNSILKVDDKLSYDVDKILPGYLRMYVGTWEDKKKVAVKRSVDSFNESELKIVHEVCNSHKGLIGYFGIFSDLTHHYMVLEHYVATLEDFVVKEYDSVINKIRRKASKKDLLMQITEGLDFLHKNHIVLGELKPAKILLNKYHKAKISNFSCAKKIPFDNNQTDLLSIDIQSLQDIYIFVLTDNKTFEYFEEDHCEIDNQVLAEDLIASINQTNLRNPPKTDEILMHPYFWDAMKKLEFIFDIRKCLELKCANAKNLEVTINAGPFSVINGDWSRNLDPHVLKDLNLKKYFYKRGEIIELLRYIRNKWAHSAGWSKGFKNTFRSSTPDNISYIDYWERTFPKLFKHIYESTKATSRNLEQIEKYFPLSTEPAELQIESLVLDVSGNLPEINQVFSDLQDLTLSNCEEVNEKLSTFLKKNGQELISLSVKNFELNSKQIQDMLKLMPNLTKIRLNKNSLPLLKTDEDLQDIRLDNLKELCLHNVHQPQMCEIFKNSKNLHKIVIEEENIDSKLMKFITHQKNLKILQTTCLTCSLSATNAKNVAFQLNILRMQIGDEYSANFCEDFLHFVLTQNQLVDICIRINMKTFSEYQRYFDHILSLETLESFSVDSDEECVKYFEATKIVNEKVVALKVWQRSKFKTDVSLYGLIATIFPNTGKLFFDRNVDMPENRYEAEYIEHQSNCATQGSEDDALDVEERPLNDSLIKLSLLKLKELTIQLNTPKQLKFLTFDALESLNVTFSDFLGNSDGSVRKFFAENPGLKSLEILIPRTRVFKKNKLVYPDGYIILIEEMMELIPLQEKMERFVLSDPSDLFYFVDATRFLERCRKSSSLKYVYIFGSEEN